MQTNSSSSSEITQCWWVITITLFWHVPVHHQQCHAWPRDGSLIVSWQTRDQPLVRMPAACPGVVCNDRWQRMTVQSDYLFYTLGIMRALPPGACLQFSAGSYSSAMLYLGQSMHQDSWFPVIWVPIDNIVKMMNVSCLMTHHSPCSEICLLLSHWNRFQSFFAFDLDCLKKLIRHMFTMFFIQLSPECFLTI